MGRIVACATAGVDAVWEPGRVTEILVAMNHDDLSHAPWQGEAARNFAGRYWKWFRSVIAGSGLLFQLFLDLTPKDCIC